MTIKQLMLGISICCVPISALAESVTLSATSSRLELTGELQSYDGLTWVIKSAMGVLRLPASDITCISGACPEGTGPQTAVASAPAEPAIAEAAPAEPVAAPAQTVAVAPAATEVVATEPTVQLATPVIAAPRNFDESRIRLAGQQAFMNDLVPLMVETWGFLEQRDFAQTGPANARVLLLSGGGQNPLDVELISASEEDIPDLMAQSFIDVALAGEEILRELPDADFSVVGLDAAAFITTRDNQINALNISDLAGILSGEISNWNQLGGQDLPIKLMLPSDDTSTASVIAEQILLDAGAQLSPNAQRIQTEAALADAVARERGAIGLVGFSEVRNARPLAISDSCGMRTTPDEFAIKTGDYPLVRRILAVYPAGGTSFSTGGLLRFMTGAMAERTLVNAGLVALAPATASVSEQGLRFAQVTLDPSTRGSEAQLVKFTQTLIDARRLSLTLRAGTQVAGLDSRGNDDLRRLAALISANRYAGQEILLVGFSDSARAGAESLTLSQSRAEAAMAELLAEIGTLPADVAVTPVGFGHVAPLACNADPRGAIVNNRIEVWARALR